MTIVAGIILLAIWRPWLAYVLATLGLVAVLSGFTAVFM